MSDLIHLERCRSCSPCISYSLPSGVIVKIVVGIPSADLKYKAISHVWGSPVKITMTCNYCGAASHTQLKSAAYFFQLMALAGADNYVWLDNISIDQDDAQDVATQIAVMGDIYSKAECVSVLLPASDQKAYDALEKILENANRLVDERWKLNYMGGSIKYELKQQDGKWASAPPEDNVFSESSTLARTFFEDIRQLVGDLGMYTYWQRAWTFQEWSLAHDIEVAVEHYVAPFSDTVELSRLRNVKSHIVYVAIMMADYKMRLRDEVLIDSGLTRGNVLQRVSEVKRLFPMEDVYITYDEVHAPKLDLQIAFPFFGTNELLGLRAAPRVPRDEFQRFKIRLQIMLDAFAASGELRQARYEADLVACWSTMCNIQYSYSKDDPLVRALVKVIRKVRELGVRIYNFHTNETTHSEVDFKFFRYATAHTQANASNRAELPGAPIFTGRADTLRHFLYGITPLEHFTPKLSMDDAMVEECNGVAIRLVNMAVVMSATNLSDIEGVQKNLTMATSGIPDGVCFCDATFGIVEMLKRTPNEWLVKMRFVTVAIFTDSAKLFAWALCPTSIDPSALCVAREQLNGTLVLAALCENSEPEQISMAATIIAYLTISDHQSGTFILPTDHDGNIDITFKTPRRRDIIVSEIQNDRRLRTRVFLKDHIIPPSTKTYTNVRSFSVMQTNLRAVEDCKTAKEHITAQLKEAEYNLSKSPMKIGLLDIDIGHPELEARAMASRQRLRIDPQYVLGKGLRVHADGQSVETVVSELESLAAGQHVEF